MCLALNPQPSTLNPQPSTLNPQPSTLNPQLNQVLLELIIAMALREEPAAAVQVKRESSFIDNLLVRIHLIIVMISVDRPCAMGV